MRSLVVWDFYEMKFFSLLRLVDLLSLDLDFVLLSVMATNNHQPERVNLGFGLPAHDDLGLSQVWILLTWNEFVILILTSTLILRLTCNVCLIF